MPPRDSRQLLRLSAPLRQRSCQSVGPSPGEADAVRQEREDESAGRQYVDRRAASVTGDHFYGLLKRRGIIKTEAPHLIFVGVGRDEQCSGHRASLSTAHRPCQMNDMSQCGSSCQCDDAFSSIDAGERIRQRCGLSAFVAAGRHMLVSTVSPCSPVTNWGTTGSAFMCGYVV